jgi:8-amino-7-oxononanoate synthase
LSDKFAFITAALEQRQQSDTLRSLSILCPDGPVQLRQGSRQLLNFSSNDYLGLSKHPALIEAAQLYAQRYGSGATASRLVTGTYSIHQALEQQLAQTHHREAALLFSTGFQANATLLPTLLDRQSLVFCDRLIHNSLLQGILASRAPFKRYRHNDLDHLETLLQQAGQAASLRPRRLLIVSETVFSMDGDRADVDRLISLAQQYNAILYLDDAHAIGVLGPQGQGLAAARQEVDIVVGTFGKAYGCFGAFVLCSQRLRDYFINVCPGFIYTTALPPPIIGAITAALTLIPSLEAERNALAQQARQFRCQLQATGIDTGPSESQIIPIMIGSAAGTLKMAHQLEHEWGILTIPIRPPTVPQNTARLRVVLSSAHHADQIASLQQALQGLEIQQSV